MIKLIAFLTRKPGLTMEEFKERWVVEHTRISGKLPGLKGYRINIAIATQPEGAPDYDGTAELWWDSLEDMEASFATQIGQEAGADGDLFSSVRIHLYTEEFITMPGPLPDIRTTS
ncbi:MAG: EthD family reductase [Anaerolineae bacterium]|nr:EthD family reductase [Anaerolineae bacterium]